MDPVIRRYTKADIPRMLELLRAGLQEHHYRNISFAEEKLQDLLYGNVNTKSFFCNLVMYGDEIGGALSAQLYEFSFSYEVYAQDRIVYIREGYHSLTGIRLLITSYVEWAKTWHVRQIRMDQSTGYKMDKFAALMKRHGFTQIGTKWLMEA